MRLPSLLLLAVAVGCAHTTAPAPTPANPATAATPATPATPATAATAATPAASGDPEVAEKEAQALLSAGKCDEALARLAPFSGGYGHHALSIAYTRATAYLYKGDFPGAAHVFDERLAAARGRHDAETEGWLHNALTWVRWAQHDQAGALEENEQVLRAIEDSTLPADTKRGTLLHYWWDRAYLLDEQPGDHRGADDARRKYEALARMPDQHDGVAVLEAFFAVLDGNGAVALAEARKVDPAKDDDVQDLYVLSIAFEAGGDHEAAEALRALIRKSNEYPMKPVILQRLAFDAKQQRR